MTIEYRRKIGQVITVGMWDTDLADKEKAKKEFLQERSLDDPYAEYEIIRITQKD